MLHFSLLQTSIYRVFKKTFPSYVLYRPDSEHDDVMPVLGVLAAWKCAVEAGTPRRSCEWSRECGSEVRRQGAQQCGV